MRFSEPHVRIGTVVFLTGVLLCWAGPPALGADDIPRMDKEELKALLGSPDLIILDARSSSDWARSGYRIKGARRLEKADADRIERMYLKDRTIVVYCA